MELRHMRYFVAVAEERSFTRAAERLWIAQPGLSQQILSLERELGVRLFDRLSRGVELTDAGRVFLEKARVALRAADDALTVAEDAGAGLTGSLRLGLSWRSRYDLAPELQHVFGLRRPGVAVTVVESQTDTLMRDLRDQRLDAAIVLGPQDLYAGVESTILSLGPVGVMMAPEHPLAQLDVVTPADIDGHGFMVSGDRGGETYDQHIRRALASLGIEHHIVAGGYGFAMLGPVRDGEALMLDGHPSLAIGAGLVWLPLEPAPSFQFDLVWMAGEQSGPLHAFIETCQEEVARRGVDCLQTNGAGRHPSPAVAAGAA
jgi:DNA-binding transcriptional LysR family regulator